MEEKQPTELHRRRLTAEEVRSKYGSGALLLLAWEIWCIRDGWFHPDPHYEYIGFSRFMAYVSFPILLFCVVMTLSAHRAIQQNRRTGDPDHTVVPPGDQK
ncbi:MAG TPA: hypothetical protein VNL17_04645 [Verrucomicrobiae bacterium]|nr:hypothetical protein [Verrucomicrobiae bacterium]